jgi:hypothetical protein
LQRGPRSWSEGSPPADEPLRVRWIEEGELRTVDPQLRALYNVHAPEDMSP